MAKKAIVCHVYILLLFLAWCLTASIWPFVESDYPGPMLLDITASPCKSIALFVLVLTQPCKEDGSLVDWPGAHFCRMQVQKFCL
jgi:hypothetical protein